MKKKIKTFIFHYPNNGLLTIEHFFLSMTNFESFNPN